MTLKKTLFILPVSLCVACGLVLISCSKPQTPVNPDACTTVIYDNLFGIEYDDYNFDECVKYFEKHRPDPAPGCSEVRKGRFVGRNLDYYINRNACAVIKMNRNEKHFASVGIVGCFSDFTKELAKSGRYDEIYKYLPCRTCDGINENGVYVGVNVMPTGETSFDYDHWTYGKWGKGAAYTNTSSDKTYCTMYLTRYVLDNAKSVADALMLIRGVNWYEPVDYPHKDEAQAFHWMIADSLHNYVVEFIDNKLWITPARDIRQPSLGTIMTNFTNALYSEHKIQHHGIGYERYDVLRYAYSDTEESFRGMEGLMQKVRYSRTYTKSVGDADFWATEFCNDAYGSDFLYGNQKLWDYPIFCGMVDSLKKMWSNPSYWYIDDTPLWFTVHTSIYDIEKREMEVLAHECFGEQQNFRSFNLDSHFAKPLEHQ